MAVWWMYRHFCFMCMELLFFIYFKWSLFGLYMSQRYVMSLLPLYYLVFIFMSLILYRVLNADTSTLILSAMISGFSSPWRNETYAKLQMTSSSNAMLKSVTASLTQKVLESCFEFIWVTLVWCWTFIYNFKFLNKIHVLKSNLNKIISISGHASWFLYNWYFLWYTCRLVSKSAQVSSN